MIPKEELRVGVRVKVQRHPKGWFGALDRYTKDGREAIIEEVLDTDVVLRFALKFGQSTPYNVGFRWLEKIT